MPDSSAELQGGSLPSTQQTIGETQNGPLNHVATDKTSRHSVDRPSTPPEHTSVSSRSPSLPNTKEYYRSQDQKAPSERSPSLVSDHNEIQHLYLTWETEIPEPPELLGGEHPDKSASPQAPNLKAYQNPFKWSQGRKATLIWLSTIGTAFTAYAPGSYISGADQIAAYFGLSEVATAVGVTVFTVGFGIAPMVLAPFSEINGRRPVFVTTGLLYVIFILCCGITRLYSGMLVSRLLAGCASSTFSTMVGGVVADIYQAKDRNTPMTLFTGGVIFGTGLGPLVSGFIASNMSWRWIFYVHTMVLAILMVFVAFFFHESRGSVLLSKKAKKLNKWYQAREDAGYYGFDMPVDGSSEKRRQRIRWKVKADEERATLAQMVYISLFRPFHLLITEPVVFFFSLWISFSWAILYMTFIIIPYAFETVYGFDLQQRFSIFAVISISGLIFTFISIYQDKLAARYGLLPDAPESRLYFACVESALLPIGLFWFGWTLDPSIHWIVPALAVGCATMGIFSVYLSVFNYLADSYKAYASSAIAAQSFCRNLIGGAFPLFTEIMFERLGFGVAGSLLGGVGVALTFVPWVLAIYGPRIRARSKFATSMAN